mgnify:CR=1 FL=1
MNELITIENIGENGIIFLNLEDVARGLGFIQIKNQVEYVRTDRVTNYLNEFSFSTCGEKLISDTSYPFDFARSGENDFIPTFSNIPTKLDNFPYNFFQDK